MDPIIVGLVVVLGKYALDKAVEVAPVVGAVAIDALSRTFEFVTRALSAGGEREATIVDEFTNDPNTYEKPFAMILQAEIERNPQFAQRVSELIAEINREVERRDLDSSYQIGVKGDFKTVGSVFGSGSVSAGGDIVGGSK